MSKTRTSKSMRPTERQEAKTAKPTERLIRITASKLFGYLDQDIQLNTDRGITILHGANGSGKTTLLRAINELSMGLPYSTVRIPFETIELYFASGRKLILEQVKQDAARITLFSDNKASSFDFPKEKPDDRMLGYVKTSSGALRLRSYRDMVNAKQMKFLIDEKSFYVEHPPEWLVQFWTEFHCTLIEEQRLFNFKKKSDQESRHFPRVVSDYSDRIKELIAESLRNYGDESQQLDRTFPGRMVRGLNASPRSSNELSELFAELDKRRSLLAHAGIIDEEKSLLSILEVGPPSLASMDKVEPSSLESSDIRKVLSLYADDMKKKLSVFDDLYRRVTLFATLLSAYFVHKKVSIGTAGIEFITDGGDHLGPESLSSGEQHILVLFFSLIFGEQGIRLVLIDEPELSLHPRWQLRLVEDLEAIRGVSQVDFILASHSPQIFQGHWEMARDLAV